MSNLLLAGCYIYFLPAPPIFPILLLLLYYLPVREDEAVLLSEIRSCALVHNTLCNKRLTLLRPALIDLRLFASCASVCEVVVAAARIKQKPERFVLPSSPLSLLRVSVGFVSDGQFCCSLSAVVVVSAFKPKFTALALSPSIAARWSG